jgi:Ni2+-binding GTPase involved in maturation of urease and hydrogenase
MELYQEITQNFTKEGKIKVLVVINKIDLAKQTEIDFILKKLKLDPNDYILTNALTGENVDKIISYLQNKYIL